ncbi:MAG: glycosyltransferase [Bryobacterales bacterium]|nr:glycosyltransferase [Bryobacterales bacterium]
MRPATSPRAAVLVFGDLGRSPRMLNHAVALADNGFQVALIGYPDTPLPRELTARPEIRVHPIRTFRRCPPNLPKPAFLAWSAARLGWAQMHALWVLLLAIPRQNVILAQNPPAIPTLLAARLAARRHRAKFVLDWHNFGYSMLAMRLGEGNATVQRSRRYEQAAGRRADAHLCVSHAMAERLRDSLGIGGARTVHDLPVRLDDPLDRLEREACLRELFPGEAIGESTLVLHCPTSWTDDEETDMLLDAAALLPAEGPRFFIVATGVGPRRAAFEERLASMPLTRCTVRTAFFSPEDYRRLLAAADCGLSFHRSSSGVDLPMKLVDFFGAGTPALALDYGPCLREQVEDGREALLFRNAEDLARRLEEIARPGHLTALRQNVRAAWSRTWGEAWASEALPVLEAEG